MSAYIELEIQNLLNETSDLDEVGQRLIQHLESSLEISDDNHFTAENINALSRFLLKSESPSLLIGFVLRHLDKSDFKIPWPYFLEALTMMGSELNEKTLNALSEGINETDGLDFAARAKNAPPLTELSQRRSDRKYKIHKDYLNNKRLLLDQLVTLRTQQLFEQEKNLLQRLQKLYPGDRDIRDEASEYKQRNALEILQKRSPKNRSLKLETFTPQDPAVEMALAALTESLLDHAEAQPEMAIDFAIALFMLENYEGALQVLSYYPDDTESFMWLRLEILLRARHYVEVLNDLARVEVILASDPETFFATAYLRAQALWGLGQKHAAVEVLEGLMASRPHYRAASALLSIWSAQ
ncbi:hypothetical protein AZI86_15160 [Bdellovibrio bacteriovorus]|uniref:Uncharacterized protein n=1 Tax=Bdellovibrio bacteriovorus TaxID=959 RepID=A0A150WIG7_BDEBC|nr:hypothetical protein [Bdellovibrio bacteriovorus]KYG63225.1 hypothetical protein AZI86_15160 [Bdellovibrio bacteriovorus]